ncbi:substrate-binding domain-containing protein [Streptomyces sp. NPDC007818]|uniref:substrate-binding domain-containing protein n=1 Tax=Streptomyces sp. NPDC007818 TaxID=3364780 RepID=UPI0036BF0CCC
MRLTPAQRQERLRQRVHELGRTSVAELAVEFAVSHVTLRKDLAYLEAQGQVRRTPESVDPVTDADEPVPGAVIGMVLPNTEYYFASIVNGVRAAAERHGARLIVATTGYDPAEDIAQTDKLLADGATGLILVPSWPTGEPSAEEGDWILQRKVPAVLVERRVPATHPLAQLDRVATDQAHGIALAVARLHAQGHERIILTVQSTVYVDLLNTSHRAALGALGLPTPSVSPLVTSSDQSEPERRDHLFEGLLRAVREHGVTAAIMHTGLDAVVTLPRLKAAGIQVPEDLAIIAYDDEVAELADVPLTSIATPKEEVGTAAVDFLLRRFGVPEASGRHLALLPDLRVRESG